MANEKKFEVQPQGFLSIGLRIEKDTQSQSTDTLFPGDIVVRLEGDNTNEWWKVVKTTNGEIGFVKKLHLIPLEEDTSSVEINLDDFIQRLFLMSKTFGGNTIWLVAVAHAQSGIRNDRDEITNRFGPFRFSKESWKALVEANPETDVQVDEIGRWQMQALIAPLAFKHYRKALMSALEADPTALQLYIAHLLGNDAAIVIASADANKPVVEVLQASGLQQEIIDFALMLLPPGQTKVSDLNEILREELQQGIDKANELLHVPSDHADIKQQLVEGFLAEGRQDLADMVNTHEFHVWIQQESSWIPSITSPPNNQGRANDGLFQIWRGHDFNNLGQVKSMSPREQAQIVAQHFSHLTPEKIKEFCNQIESGTYNGWG